MPDLLQASAAPSVPVSEPVVCAHVASALLEVTGDDAVAFLQGQLSSDVAALAAGQAQFWSYNSPKGRTLANGVLWRADTTAGPPRVLVLLAADLAETIARRLATYVLRAKATVRDVRDRYTLLGLAGAGGGDAARNALGITVATLTAVPFRSDATAVALPDGRVVIASPATGAPLVHAALARHAAMADASMWRWFGIAAWRARAACTSGAPAAGLAITTRPSGSATAVASLRNGTAVSVATVIPSALRAASPPACPR